MTHQPGQPAPKLTPGSFVTSPFIACPACGHTSFGIVSIDRHTYRRRCKDCYYPEGTTIRAVYELPRVSKLVVYLDQFCISEMMKSLSPRIDSDRRARVQPVWRRLFERLDSTYKLQLVVCPESRFHWSETHVAAFAHELTKTYQYFSGGCVFREDEYIKMAQVHKHAVAYLEQGRSPTKIPIEREDAIEGDPDIWEERFSIHLKPHFDVQMATALRETRQQSHEGLKESFEHWQRESGKRFEDWYRAELAGFVPAVIRTLQKDLLTRGNVIRRLASHAGSGSEQSAGITPLDLGTLLPGLPYRLLHMLLELFRKHTADETQAVLSALEYLRTADFECLPFLRISSLLLAALARRAAAGQRRPPNRGMINDIQMVSVLMPYCDAIVVDKELHSLLCERDVQSRLAVPTRVFSPRNIDAFLTLLEETCNACTSEHRAIINQIYGPDWLTPYTELYEQDSHFAPPSAR